MSATLFTRLTGQETPQDEVGESLVTLISSQEKQKDYKSWRTLLERAASFSGITDTGFLVKVGQELRAEPHGELAFILSEASETEFNAFIVRKGWSVNSNEPELD